MYIYCESTITSSPGQWLKHFQTLHSEHTLTKKQEETQKTKCA